MDEPSAPMLGDLSLFHSSNNPGIEEGRKELSGPRRDIKESFICEEG